MEYFANSKGSTKELLVGSLLAATSSMLRDSSLELFPGRSEKLNLFISCIAKSGTGKTPACNFGVIHPLVSSKTSVEKIHDTTILIDDASSIGLFDLFCRMDKQFTPILGNDEAFTFLKTVCSINVKSTELSMDRLCKLFDAEHWYSV